MITGGRCGGRGEGGSNQWVGGRAGKGKGWSAGGEGRAHISCLRLELLALAPSPNHNHNPNPNPDPDPNAVPNASPSQGAHLAPSARV